MIIAKQKRMFAKTIDEQLFLLYNLVVESKKVEDIESKK